MPSSKTVSQKDENFVSTLIGVSSTDLALSSPTPAPVPVAVNPVTFAIIVEVSP